MARAKREKRGEAFDTPQVGENIRRARKEARLTLKELASASGVEPGMLEEIESEKANPTVAVLWKLARALRSPMSEILGEGAPSRAIELRARSEHDVLMAGKGRVLIRPLSPHSMEGKLEFYEVVLKSGGRIVSEPHVRGTVEITTVHKGRIAVELKGGERSELDEGDTCTYHADRRHTIENLVPWEAVLYMVVVYER